MSRPTAKSNAVQLSALTDFIQYGYTAKSSSSTKGPKYLRITDIQDDHVEWAAVPHVTIAPEDLARYRLQAGDIVFARSGATVGKSFLIQNDPGDAVFASYLIRVRCTSGRLDPRYAALYFKSEDYWQQIRDGATGTGQPNFNGSKLGELGVPKRPLSEQLEIVERLEALLERSKNAREELVRIPRLVERYKEAMSSAAFRGDLTREWREQYPMSRWSVDDQKRIKERRQTYIAGRRGSRLRDAPPLEAEGSSSELPNSWMSGCIADVADLRTGYAFKSTWFSNDGPKLLRGANIAPGKVVWDDTKRLSPDYVPEFEKEFRLSAGDIVIAMDRPMISGGLKAAILAEEDDGAFLVQRVGSPICSPLVVPKFLWFLINSRIFIEHIERHATGSDLPHISSNDILTTPLPLPPVEEQREIARSIEKLHDSVTRQLVEVLRATSLLDRLDRATLAKAFRGELVRPEQVAKTRSFAIGRRK